jgi:hypothetical protein
LSIRAAVWAQIGLLNVRRSTQSTETSDSVRRAELLRGRLTAMIGEWGGQPV